MASWESWIPHSHSSSKVMSKSDGKSVTLLMISYYSWFVAFVELQLRTEFVGFQLRTTVSHWTLFLLNICLTVNQVIKYFLNSFSFSLINLTRFSFFSLHLRAVFAWFNILPEAFFKLSTSFSEVWIPQKDTVFQEWAHWWHMQREHHLLATQYYFPVSSSKNLLCS